MTRKLKTPGFTLVELLIAMAVGAFMITGILTMVQASTTSFRLQQGLGQVQESARFAAEHVASAVRPAGYQPTPWLAALAEPAIAPGTSDGHNAVSDRLVVRYWSRLNCFDNVNPAQDAQGQPQDYLLETSLNVTLSGNLARTCRYGPDAGQLITQINNLGLAEGVEAFQVLFAEDTDADGSANQWVRAGQWQDENRVLGVRFALLLASPQQLTDATAGPIQVLDETLATPSDGRLRRVYTGAVAINGRIL